MADIRLIPLDHVTYVKHVEGHCGKVTLYISEERKPGLIKTGLGMGYYYQMMNVIHSTVDLKNVWVGLKARFIKSHVG